MDTITEAIILKTIKKMSGLTGTTIYDDQINELAKATIGQLDINGLSNIVVNDQYYKLYIQILSMKIIPIIKENYKYSDFYQQMIDDAIYSLNIKLRIERD